MQHVSNTKQAGLESFHMDSHPNEVGWREILDVRWWISSVSSGPNVYVPVRMNRHVIPQISELKAAV